uniref:EST1_DNA_bind domain-containing protein n=1 Tax=Strongyloides papillosus TaxID=174720 RepID=A0A0N5C4L7_STREA
MNSLSTELKNKKQYDSKLRDDKLVYFELYNLYFHVLENKYFEFEHSLKLIAEQVQKYPESISKQMYLLSYLASQCLSKLGTKIHNFNLLKKLLSFILELVLVAEKNSTDNNSMGKRVVCVLSPYVQYFSISRSTKSLGDILSRLIKVLIFLSDSNRSEFLSLVNSNYIAIKNLSECYPGSWVPYILKTSDYQSKMNKGPTNYQTYKDSFEDSILDSLYEPPLNGFEVKKYKLKNSYNIYEEMQAFRYKLKEEMKTFLA